MICIKNIFQFLLDLIAFKSWIASGVSNIKQNMDIVINEANVYFYWILGKISWKTAAVKAAVPFITLTTVP